jgi:hypothetical protein
VNRAPQQLRHRGRAVTREDYEWIAIEASPEVARVRCLPTTGTSGRVERGHVTLAVAPWSRDARPDPSVELLARIRLGLTQRLPAGLARGLHLVRAEYSVVTVHASVATMAPSDAAAVEEQLRARLDAYLHPLTGNAGRGWAFGEPVHLSAIARLVEETDGVDHADWLRLTLDGAYAGDVARPGPDALVSSGDHQLTLSIGGDR